MRASVLLLLMLPSLSGCMAACDDDLLFADARAGKVVAVHEVGELGNPQVPSAKSAPPSLREGYEVLATRLDDPDEFKRLAAVEALRRLSTRSLGTYRDHFRDLFDGLLSDEVPAIRWRAAWALGRLKLSSDALRAAASDSEDPVAERAVWALGQARDEKSEQVLVAALDRSPAIASQAVTALKRVTGMRLGDDPQAWKDAWSRRESSKGSPDDDASAPNPPQAPPETPGESED